jgi:dienelactone hydrolase
MKRAAIFIASALWLAGCKETPVPPTSTSTTAASTAIAAPPPPKASVATSPSRIVTEEVTYSARKTKMSGYLAHPPNAKGLPGILVVHEWWGHNDYVRSRADMLAREGYVALAVDMYGEGKKTDHPDDAKKFSAEVFSRLDDAEARFDAARKLLAEHDTTDPEKIAAVGYCFGGGIVLHMARKGMDLDVAASFHGSLATKTPATKGSIKGMVFIAHGAADPMVPPDQVDAFKKEMEAAGANLHFHAYDGATHAFSNPNATQIGKQHNLPIAYDEKADKASWKALMALLADVFPKRAE